MTNSAELNIIDSVLMRMMPWDGALAMRDRLREAGFEIIYVKPTEITGEQFDDINRRST
jgi:N-dimethylarginine dimethylaminohydrolase